MVSWLSVSDEARYTTGASSLDGGMAQQTVER